MGGGVCLEAACIADNQFLLRFCVLRRLTNSEKIDRNFEMSKPSCHPSALLLHCLPLMQQAAYLWR